MKIYYISASNGDGSSRTEFYDSKECIDYLCNEETGSEDYWDGDGGSWGSFECDNFKGPLETMEDIKNREYY